MGIRAHVRPGDGALNGEPTLLEVRGLRLTSELGGAPRTIVDGLDLTVSRGETVALVGESGSGKSMTARAIIGLLPPGVAASGEIVYEGSDIGREPRAHARVRGSGIGLVLQDPYTLLNPLLRCGTHVEESLPEGSRRGRTRRRRLEAQRRLGEVGIVDASVFDRYPFQLSGGMRQRVAIAAALARDPSLLIADEPTTALDVSTQREILALLKSVQRSRDMSLLLITHDLRVAFSMCNRVYVLYAGSLLEVGHAAGIDAAPLHPYTLALLLSEAPVDRRLEHLAAIEGSVPAAHEVSTCCAFSARCAWRRDECTSERPPLQVVEPGRLSACVRLGQIRSELSRARHADDLSAARTRKLPQTAPLVSIRALSKAFEVRSKGGGRHLVKALDDVSLEIRAGESVGLVGESGSGKTTLGRCLVGLETATSGEITVDGIRTSDFVALAAAERRRARRTVQMIFQDPYSSLNPAHSVRWSLEEALGRDSDRGRDRTTTVARLLDQVGLPPSYAARKPAALSGGERQRVAIARALAVRPQLLVCDEPASALDVSVQAQILNLLRRLQTEVGVSYLFISHDLAVVRQMAERLYVLYRGKMVEEGSVDDILDRPKHPYTVRLVQSVPRPGEEWLASS